jgi:hypothetical protein
VALSQISEWRRGSGISHLAFTFRPARPSPDESRHHSNGRRDNGGGSHPYFAVRRVRHRNQGLQRLDLRDATDAKWTQLHFRQKFKFQNPIFQNYRHVRAVQDLLDFLPREAIKSVVVFSGNAEFKTEIPDGVLTVDQLAEFLKRQIETVMSPDRLQFCVGRLETARLAISGKTDIEHVESLARRRGRTA